MRDLIVAGAGPAGLCAAIAAAARGMQVLVLDPHDGEIDKACGEGLMPATLEALASLGVERPPGRPFPQIRYQWGERVAAGTLPTPGLGVRRTQLHRVIAERAAALGVEREQAKVTTVTQDAAGVTVNGHRARWLIGADGLHSTVRGLLDLDAPAPGAERFGLRRHFHVAPWSDSVDVLWGPDAEAYVTPVDDQLVGVAILFGQAARARIHDQPGSAYDRLLAGFPTLTPHLAEPATAVRGAGPFQVRSRRRVSGRVLLVGDAAGYVDAITGEGTKVGILGAIAAAHALADGQPERYEREWTALWRPYLWATTGLLALTRGPARTLLPPVLTRAPRVFDAALRVLAG